MLDTLQAISQERYVPPYASALVHAGLRQNDVALECLERAFHARDVHILFLTVDPKWDARFAPIPDSKISSDAATSHPSLLRREAYGTFLYLGPSRQIEPSGIDYRGRFSRILVPFVGRWDRGRLRSTGRGYR